MERLVGRTELRAEGRTVHGVVMRYGAIGDRRERFEPRALRPVGHTWFDIGHDQTRILTWMGAGLSFEHDADELRMVAELPRNPLADFALGEIRSGRRRGLSVEMRVTDEYREAQTGVRVVRSADLPGVGLVTAPSFPESQVLEVRRKLGPATRGGVKMDSPVSCRCRDGCDTIRIKIGAFDETLAAVEQGQRAVSLFTSNNFGTPLATTQNGALMVGLDSGALSWTVREGFPDIQAARDFLAQRAAGQRLFSRLYWPRDTEVAEKVGREWVVTSAQLAGIELAVVSGDLSGLLPVRFGGERRSRRKVWTL